MSEPEAKKQGLKKELGLFSVFALATGTTLSGGFFLLPGVALAEYQAGPAIILAYLLAALPLIPAMLCLVELSTAMPKAGGGYYFLDRAMGPLIGTIGGLGTWIALMLKTAFALIGMGAYLALLSDGLREHVIFLAIGLALLFGCLNLAGAKKASAMQGYLVVGLLAILAIFMYGLGEFAPNQVFNPQFLDSGWDSILATSGMVFVSYVGISKVASLAEEVKNPDRNLPLGVGLSLVVCISIYAVGTYLMVGVLGTDAMAQSQTVVADAAAEFLGPKGRVLMVVAAVLAFASVANSGILSASRYPLAMARDHLVSPKFRQLSESKIPRFAIVVTMVLIVLVICTMPVGKIAKLASAFQLLMFALVCLAVIVMRESKIDSYDPGYRAPFYPYLQIFGVISACWFIGELGWAPLAFSLMLLLAGGWWYRYYAMDKVRRDGAIYHIFERLGQRRYEGSWRGRS